MNYYYTLNKESRESFEEDGKFGIRFEGCKDGIRFWTYVKGKFICGVI
jgi:hypothetical protein